MRCKGGTTFHFVTDGVESGSRRLAKPPATATCRSAGGADVTQQLLRAGLLDELTLSVAPVLLGDGTRLLANLGADVRLEQVDVVQAPGVTHLRYRALR